MAKKAILVTEDNYKKLASRFLVEAEDFEDFVGYYLVMDFGTSEEGYEQYDVLSKYNFNAQFVKVRDIHNDFIEIAPR